ncbi:hypothetical protein SmJEL517_g02794 [Synchytrium microbalum]|uniref:Histone acetyltransferase n=1 Tax=Synchytrium microbalum TaxID=1806994 RepID=A0A507C9A6_9FUNG|nr:uncharacterized protein SmJEL517_g02794 [Synchytrium microbalum]TPX34554.1 hypothetical protein SmJEL517_g02794 [Synchytrium microbalum]
MDDDTQIVQDSEDDISIKPRKQRQLPALLPRSHGRFAKITKRRIIDDDEPSTPGQPTAEPPAKRQRKPRRESKSRSPTRTVRKKKEKLPAAQRRRRVSTSVQPEEAHYGSPGSLASDLDHHGSDRPLEERAFTETWPDLNPKRPLPLLKFPRAAGENRDPSVGAGKKVSDQDGGIKEADIPEHATNRGRHTNKRTPSPAKSADGDIRMGESSNSDVQEIDGVLPLRDDFLGVGEPTVIPPLNINILKPVPKPSFRKVYVPTPLDNDRYIEPRPSRVSYRGNYIHYIEPSEDELAERVEYDMDEQDKSWLLAYNQERRADGAQDVTEAFFELIMDRFEKEWFDLTKDLVKEIKTEMEYPEDITCAVCDDGEAENSNAIVFCDGCNLAVHQDCYGIPFIPEGQYLCRKCMISPETPVSCVFCPNEGGAFKQTVTNRWAHVLCSLFIPEVGFRNPTYMEPVDNIDKIPKSRWKLTCYICKRKKGACIQCASKNCYIAYHVTCAQKAKLYMKMKSHNPTYDDNLTKTFCDKHTPREHRDEFDIEARITQIQEELAMDEAANHGYSHHGHDHGQEDDEQEVKKRRRSKGKARRIVEDDDTMSAPPTDRKGGKRFAPSNASKSAQAHSTDFMPKAPVIPAYILTIVMNEVIKVNFRKKNVFIEDVARYWSLKRESRRGAPLLKRLHLEPWTANASAHKEDEKIKAQRYEVLTYIRKDLERARILAEMVRKREREKLRQAQVQKEYFENMFYPLTKTFRSVLEDMRRFDSYQFFHIPVRAVDVPDYYDVIKVPMDFSTIEKKIDNYEYRSIASFEASLDVSNHEADVNLICSNCMIYNQKDTVYYKTAQRLQKRFEYVFQQLAERVSHWHTRGDTGILDVPFAPQMMAYGPSAGFVDPTEDAERIARVEERIRKETIEDAALAVAETEAVAAAEVIAKRRAEKQALREQEKQQEKLADVVAALTSPRALRNRIFVDEMGLVVPEPPPAAKRASSPLKQVSSSSSSSKPSDAVMMDVDIPMQNGHPLAKRARTKATPDADVVMYTPPIEASPKSPVLLPKSPEIPSKSPEVSPKTPARPLKSSHVRAQSPAVSTTPQSHIVKSPKPEDAANKPSTEPPVKPVKAVPQPVQKVSAPTAKRASNKTAQRKAATASPSPGPVKLYPPDDLPRPSRPTPEYEAAVTKLLSVAIGSGGSGKRAVLVKPWGEAVPVEVMDKFIPFDENPMLIEMIEDLDRAGSRIM